MRRRRRDTPSIRARLQGEITATQQAQDQEPRAEEVLHTVSDAVGDGTGVLLKRVRAQKKELRQTGQYRANRIPLTLSRHEEDAVRRASDGQAVTMKMR